MAGLQVMSEQQSLAPNEDVDFTPYAGQWVLLRGGSVALADPDPTKLMNRSDAQDDDVLVHVPAADAPAALY